MHTSFRRFVRGAVLAAVVAAVAAACGVQDDAVDSRASPTRKPSAEQIVIQTTVLIAAEEGAEPIATGDVLDGSTLGGSPFCAGGTIRDTHAHLDPAVERLGLIDRIISCSDGTVRIVYSPGDLQGGQPQPGQPQPGSWTIVSGTGAFETLRGSGEMETVYDADENLPARGTLTGTVSR